MKKMYSLEIRGKESSWGFPVELDPAHVDEYRADGLVVMEICNTIPEWVPSHMIRVWCFFQDIFNFKNPFSKA